MIHELKTAPIAFQGLLSLLKTFEYRHNDRNFQVGDTLVLREYNEPLGEYTGRYLNAEVTYILHGPAFHIPRDYCIMSIKLDTVWNRMVTSGKTGKVPLTETAISGDFRQENTYKGGYTQLLPAGPENRFK